MTTLVSADDFLDLLAQSHLVSPQCMKQLRSQVPAPGKPGHTAQEFAAVLVRQKVLTPFQSKRLLAGKPDGFFIGKYRILDLLGAGGMGKVFLAEQTTMKRAIALKLLPTKDIGNSGAMVRFHREARAVAKLRHPNITVAHDFDQIDESHFFVMEYVEGLDLQRVVEDRGQLPVGLAVHLACQAANGLEHARQHQMVHRDIKPGNLMVEPNGVLKILDLGLVVVGSEKGPGSQLTLSEKDVVLGTADYIAPEQAIDSHDVDIRADIYSLGGVLYFMLSGQAPYSNKSITQKLLAHQNQEPRPIRELAPDVPPELATILSKMMAKEPKNRFSTPREVREALQAFAKPSRPYDPSKIRYSRATVEQIIRFGGLAPSTSSVRLPRVGDRTSSSSSSSIDLTGQDLSPTNALSPTDKPAPTTSATVVLPPSKATATETTVSARSAGPETGATMTPGRKRRRKKKARNRTPVWLGVAGLAVFTTVAAIVLIGMFYAGSEPEMTPPVAEQQNSALPPKVTLGPGGQNISLQDAVRRAPNNGQITLADKAGGWKSGTVLVNGPRIRNRGKLTITGNSSTVVSRGDARPIFRFVDTEGLTLSNLVIDGGGKRGPVIQVVGKAYGLTLRDITFKNVRGECVEFVGATGKSDSPVRMVNCNFLTPGMADFEPVVFRSAQRDSKSQHVEILGCTFGASRMAVQVKEPVLGLTIKECQFNNSNNAVKFTPAPSSNDEKNVEPVTKWSVSGWWPLDEVPSFTPKRHSIPDNSPALKKSWKPVEAKWGLVQLTNVLGNREEAVAYAYAEFTSNRTGQRRIFVGADDEVTIWVNGQQAFEHLGHQGLIPREFSGVAQFQEGKNRIWIRVVNGVAASGFSLHIADGYVPLTAPAWKNVTISQCVFENCSKAIVFDETPADGATVSMAGNTFANIRHHPILVARSNHPFVERNFRVLGNQDVRIPAQFRDQQRDPAAYHLVPLK